MERCGTTRARTGIEPGGVQESDVDGHVAARLRERRAALGLTQRQVGELIGVTSQQVHKYERGINRISAGSLHAIGWALGVDVGYFFAGLDDGPAVFAPTPQQRRMADLGWNQPGEQHP